MTSSSRSCIVLILLCGLLGGCGGGGGGGGSSQPNAMPPPVPAATFPPPPTLSDAFVQQAHPVVLPSEAPPARMSPAILGFLESLQTMMAHRTSSVGSADKEIVGTFISGGGPYTGITGIFSAYSSSMLQLTRPGASGINQLFAPLVMPPDHGCLATGSYYYNYGSGPQAAFVVSDLCAFDVRGPLTALFTPMNANFLASYVRNDSSGIPSYESVSFTPDPPSDASTWYVVLYNFTSGGWDLVTSAGGNRPRTEGGSYFASSYLMGPCPVLPLIAASHLALFSAAGGYEPVGPTMKATTSRVLSPPGFADVVDNCFLADMTGPSYNFTVPAPNSTWTVMPH